MGWPWNALGQSPSPVWPRISRGSEEGESGTWTGSAAESGRGGHVGSHGNTWASAGCHRVVWSASVFNFAPHTRNRPPRCAWSNTIRRAANHRPSKSRTRSVGNGRGLDTCFFRDQAAYSFPHPRSEHVRSGCVPRRGGPTRVGSGSGYFDTSQFERYALIQLRFRGQGFVVRVSWSDGTGTLTKPPREQSELQLRLSKKFTQHQKAVSKISPSSGDYLHLRGIQSGENLHTATIRADPCEILFLPRQVIPINPVILYQKLATMQ